MLEMKLEAHLKSASVSMILTMSAFCLPDAERFEEKYVPSWMNESWRA